MLMPPKTRDWRWFMFLSGISSLPEFTVIASHALLVGAAIHRPLLRIALLRMSLQIQP